MKRRDYTRAVVLVFLATAAALPFRGRIADSELVMVFFLAIVIAAMRGKGPALLAAAMSVAAFDLLFVPPYWSYRVEDARHLATFTMMLVVGLVVGTLTARLRREAEASEAREKRKAALLDLARELTVAREQSEVAEVSARHVRRIVDGTVVMFLADEAGTLQPVLGGGTLAAFDPVERAVARWAHEEGRASGCGSDRHVDSLGLYLPLRTAGRAHGVLGVLVDREQQVTESEPRRLLEAIADLVSLAVERVRLERERTDADVRLRSEALRSTLLSSVSHDLRTPLAAIKGAATALLSEPRLEESDRRELLAMAQDEADRLERLVSNLLQMTKLESGGLHVKKSWVPVEEVVGSAIRRFGDKLAGRVRLDLPADDLAPMDDVLMDNVIANLLDNVVQHTPAGTPVDVRARLTPEAVVVEVADRGPGFPPGSAEKLFEKFWQHEGASGGSGLGLPICRGIVEAHGGCMTAHDRDGGGALFRISIPRTASIPTVPAEHREPAS